jgi:hypothetical protein
MLDLQNVWNTAVAALPSWAAGDATRATIAGCAVLLVFTIVGATIAALAGPVSPSDTFLIEIATRACESSKASEKHLLAEVLQIPCGGDVGCAERLVASAAHRLGVDVPKCALR